MGRTRDVFENKLYEIWATYFDCSPLMLKNGGSTITPLEKLKDTGMIYLYTIGQRSIVQCDIAVRWNMVNVMQVTALRNGVSYGLTGADIQAELVNQHVEVDHVEWLHYLYPDDFKPYIPSEFEIRQLSDADKEALDALKSVCTPYEVDDGWVHVTDELGFGAFDGDVMVACATMYERHGFADPGVLVHPDYRQRGLGKAVVSPICEWVLDKDRIMDYRCVISNRGSVGIARSLGFTHYFTIEGFKVMNYA